MGVYFVIHIVVALLRVRGGGGTTRVSIVGRRRLDEGVADGAHGALLNSASGKKVSYRH
jgi:hypothetical protein